MRTPKHRSLPTLSAITALLALGLWVAHPLYHSSDSPGDDHGAEHCLICLLGHQLNSDLAAPAATPSAPESRIISADSMPEDIPRLPESSPTRSPRSPPRAFHS